MNQTSPAGALVWPYVPQVSTEAMQIYRASDVIDLHIEAFIWTRILGYNLSRKHGSGLLNGRFYSQTDFPRVREAHITGAVWSISTNPLRRRHKHTPVLLKNLARLRKVIAADPEQVALVTDFAGYQNAKSAGKHACWLGIQGGNALDSGPNDLDLVPDNCISRITLMHMTNSSIGHTSSPLSGSSDQGLKPFGKEFVAQMNAKRVLVDLAHINRKGFWDALDVHDSSQPAIVSHTGVCGVYDNWRNIDDAQIKAIANTGGVIGIIFQSGFLGDHWNAGSAESIVRHMEHVIRVAGEDYVSLGSDWDGMIVTPRDMKTALELPLLVEIMLRRNWTPEQIQKTLGGNYLRVMKMIRPGG
ncbi:dipeptidase [Alcanivorax sp. 1008]|uniref:dipeptidase n=1 Tax=Alcanivorax sp. 1008 TaxID=2816853 RepID=UPI001DE050FD|nr:membrane dipeptidase [Alcanivorax sp. 1008]MCC1498295.1 membrane dipeptidase [Alcanivorax sp. 1008]